MAKTKYYAVRKGREPGVYMDWESCKQQVHGYAGSEFKSFSTANEAFDYMGNVQGTVIYDKPKIKNTNEEK